MTHITRLCIDGGQSGIRLRGTADDGSVLTASAPGVLTDRPVLDQMADEVLAFASANDVTCDEVAVGVSGLTPAATMPERLLDAVRPIGVSRVAVAHDSISGYLAANDTETGVMLAVGTGVVVLAVAAGGVAKVDGWGNLIGDAGSGYWVGREGLIAVMRAFDGRGDETELTALAEDAFGPLDEIYMVLQSDPRRVSRIAAFCRTTVDAARAGDSVATEIVRRAAAELAHSARSALVRAGWAEGSPTRVSAVGSLPTKSTFFREHLEDALHDKGLGGAVQQPLHTEPIDGVAALLDVAPQHPLRTHIAMASI
ncbi:N-acetylglucosamine kinase [Paramicrobacterium agarici]|uniref:N-acetylglucosamine kinase-like BadF-type ATPase n=1 Tax=Paramicrobacterium agarici TaxID=630514 RepID=A0A2A9DRM5_9MICO|nr:BadF/BadG/BcrA/BcrD ATPase family protein [Microbacterium agarici]PFG29437.1 N-acetylglucosamine kinase-like BadF-type ATPase [Microbacterium agarici]